MTYRWVEHTAELELELEAASAEGVFAEALAAFASLLDDGETGERITRDVSAEAGDRPGLLVEWLQELVFLAETERFVPDRLVGIELRLGAVRTVIEGRRDSPPPVVKAVTYHGLQFEPSDGGWRARVVLDV